MLYLQEGCPSSVTQQAVAHAYGETALGFECGEYTEISEIQNPKLDYRWYCSQKSSNRQEFAYRFKEYNPDDTQKVYPYLTNRTITAAAGECVQHDVIGTREEANEAKTFTYTNGSSTATITIPKSSLGREGTTYIYRDTEKPESAKTYACGSDRRCISMWAYKNPGENERDAFYECPIRISTVNNSTLSEHNVPDDVARTAAASIALQGRFRFTGNSSNKNFIQHQFYASG
jgi:hypothetical protein